MTTTITFEEAVGRIFAAHDFQDLAGGAAGGPAYRKWAKAVHPDAVSAARRATATDAFAKLSALYKARSEAGTAATGEAAGGARGEARAEPVVQGRRRAYRMGRVFAKGDLAELFADGSALIKVPRQPADNDLMEAEAKALRRLWLDGDPRFRPYAPRLIETFVHEDDRRRRRRVNVLERQHGMISLAEIDRDLDPRDVAWMWRRLLTALGWAHRAGVVHGAVLPEHVLIHPQEHGLVLVDWCYAGLGRQQPDGSYAGHRPAAIVKARRDFYPPEVLHDRSAGPATDIYMATRLMTRLIGPRIPASLRRFAAGCTYDAPRMRPQDAWALLGEFDDLIHQLYGPRKFRPFVP
ncbi:molecular chaperone DnaJ [Actinoplanes sp. NEAU-A12]|uniref:Molecular chaperone DnaJ n=1 Tax=Actinoplanes sandaracinus TaxID=3045177 RepID=A0ABT6WPI4_9ACTN|nr:molecular chaperone DnaJ [Actinoplanes sandaracinus]MDI6101623.1 molecular chaperone DnaJ [Actinoplanes sandaracinus]